jgi:fructokinase
MSQTIYTIGESIYDIVFKNNIPVSGTVGGSMLNASVTLGRLSVPVHFISHLGKDKIGNIIIQFLNENNVNTDYISRYENGKTPVALAFLDSDNNAEYDFYKIHPSTYSDELIPDFNANDILLFGSFYSVSEIHRKQLISLLNKAKENNCIIIYDPNFRKSCTANNPNFMNYFRENVQFADIVRGSDEDFYNIFNENKAEIIYNKIVQLGCQNLIYTQNKKEVKIFTSNFQKTISNNSENLQIISTIGAGDTFNAGLVYGIISNKINQIHINSISENTWENIVKTSSNMATHVCTSYENYISVDFTKKFGGRRI